MKKILFAALLLLPIFLCAQTAKIKIDIDRTIGEIDPKIYGVFMEPIQRNSTNLSHSISRHNINQSPRKSV